MPAKSKKAPASQANPPQPLAHSNSTKSAPPPLNVAKPDNGSSNSKASTNGQHAPTVDLPPTTEAENAGNASGGAPAVNRKKQKRREKEAAKKAAEQLSNGHNPDFQSQQSQAPYSAQGRGPPKGYFSEEPEYTHPDFIDDGELDDHFYSGEDEPGYPRDATSNHEAWLLGNAAKKKRKNKGHTSEAASSSLGRPAGQGPKSHYSHPPPLSSAAIRSAHRMSSDPIWNTSTQAERENIKQFWLELGEDERRSLVKVEKEAVLRKMKEQQKHSCSCSVCGRKRTAIEEELEVLYDAYYEELEQFANHNNDLSNAPQIMPPPQPYRPLRNSLPQMAGAYPTGGRRVHELGEDDEELDDEEYDEDEEPYSDEDIEDLPPGPADFFTFGNSLTVKDGILTVADDLLKNDGKHFIDMMEQLAERRMQREEAIHYPSAALAHQTSHQGHNHDPLDDEDDYDEDDDEEDYDSQEGDDFDDDEMDSMTEEQRMEEGRRMFQIFAARMFEQRVLTAYREKVAHERQQKLIEELDEESRLDTQREAKKAKEAAKKKEKKKQQKQAKEEEKAKKEAEKAAQEAAAKEIEEKRLEEQRQKKEEQRKKREAEKKAAEDDRLKKEAEKQRRAQEERDRQAELERKQKEIREREKKKRDEARKKEREDRETREKEIRERKAKEDAERKAKEDHTRKEREAATKADKDRFRQDQAARRQPVALPPGLHPSHLQSPHFQVATPIVPPKIPTPVRNRQSSQVEQPSHSSSPRSQQANTENSRSSVSPASVAVPQTPMATAPAKAQGQPPMLHHPQPSAPLSPLSSQGRTGQPPFNMNGVPGMGFSGPSGPGPLVMPNMAPSMPMYQGPPMGGQQRFGPPHNMPFPPGFAGPRHFPPTQAMPFQVQAPTAAPISGPPNQTSKAPSHSRKPSETVPEPLGPPAPIARPGPIGRPPSTTPDKQKIRQKGADPEMEQLATQLGSKALLDDSDIPLSAESDTKSSAPSLGAPGSGRVPFTSSFGDGKSDKFSLPGQGWSGFSPSLSGASNWGPSPASSRPGPAWPQPNNNAFGAIGGGLQNIPRSHAPRPVTIRLMLVQACKQLATGPSSDGFVPVQNVLRQAELLKSPNEPPISIDEMEKIFDTEGNSQNGGGYFEVRNDLSAGQMVKFEPGASIVRRGTVGDIGSPVVSHGQLAAFGGIGFGPPGRNF